MEKLGTTADSFPPAFVTSSQRKRVSASRGFFWGAVVLLILAPQRDRLPDSGCRTPSAWNRSVKACVCCWHYPTARLGCSSGALGMWLQRILSSSPNYSPLHCCGAQHQPQLWGEGLPFCQDQEGGAGVREKWLLLLADIFSSLLASSFPQWGLFVFKTAGELHDHGTECHAFQSSFQRDD